MFATKYIQGQVVIVAIVPVRESSFLIAMQWIVCRIDIQNDLFGWVVISFKKKINQ